MLKIKWIKQLTRENTLLDRSFRTLAYGESLKEIGKVKMTKCPIIGKGRITSLYYDPENCKEQQEIILDESLNGKIGVLSKKIIRFLEEGYVWSKENASKKLTNKEIINYIEEFNIHHARARGALIYGYWGSPAIAEKLKDILGEKIDKDKIDPTLSVLSTPKRVDGVLTELYHTSEDAFEKQSKMIKDLKLDDKEFELVEVLSWFTFFYEFGERVSCFMFDEMIKHLKETVENEKEFEELQWYDPDSLIDYFNGKRLTSEEIAKRKHFYILRILDGKLDIVRGKEAEEIYKSEFDESLPEETRELRGTVASQGKVKGQAKIVITIDDQKKMKKGDILISTMTTPRLMNAMKLASAIVTDEGGLTAHAAIIAREFGIPCIVGTKYATKFIKDGDMIEVDADKGIVRKI